MGIPYTKKTWVDAPLTTTPLSAANMQIIDDAIQKICNGGVGSLLDADFLDSMTSATAATPSTIVARDSSGNFSAVTITASLTGHASLDLALTGGTLSGVLNTNSQINSSVGTGTAPLVIASTTKVTNLNADRWDDKHTSDVITFSNITDATSSTAAGIIMSGGLAVAKKIIAGTSVTAPAIVGSTSVSSPSLVSTVAVGTAPLTITSTTKVDNLNADQLDGLHASNSAGGVAINNGVLNVSLNAALLNGAVESVAPTGGTIVKRDGSGAIDTVTSIQPAQAASVSLMNGLCLGTAYYDFQNIDDLHNIDAGARFIYIATDATGQHIVKFISSSVTTRISADYGETWSNGGNLPTTGFTGIIHDGTNFVAYISSTSGNVVTSSDGASWTSVGAHSAHTYNDHCYVTGGGILAITADKKAVYSADSGDTWTTSGNLLTNQFLYVTYLPVSGLIIAWGKASTTTVESATSVSGAWTVRTLSSSGQVGSTDATIRSVIEMNGYIYSLHVGSNCTAVIKTAVDFSTSVTVGVFAGTLGISLIAIMSDLIASGSTLGFWCSIGNQPQSLHYVYTNDDGATWSTKSYAFRSTLGNTTGVGYSTRIVRSQTGVKFAPIDSVMLSGLSRNQVSGATQPTVILAV